MAEFDLLIIGGGWGGYSAAQTFAQGGRRVALVEANKIGGVCLHSGCIPTKALLETAATLRTVRTAADRGVIVTDLACAGATLWPIETRSWTVSTRGCKGCWNLSRSSGSKGRRG